jgi:hypothetical protein
MFLNHEQRVETLKNEFWLIKSLIKMSNNRDPKREPCGTPEEDFNKLRTTDNLDDK